MVYLKEDRVHWLRRRKQLKLKPGAEQELGICHFLNLEAARVAGEDEEMGGVSSDQMTQDFHSCNKRPSAYFMPGTVPALETQQ